MAPTLGSPSTQKTTYESQPSGPGPEAPPRPLLFDFRKRHRPTPPRTRGDGGHSGRAYRPIHIDHPHPRQPGARPESSHNGSPHFQAVREFGYVHRTPSQALLTGPRRRGNSMGSSVPGPTSRGNPSLRFGRLCRGDTTPRRVCLLDPPGRAAPLAAEGDPKAGPGALFRRLVGRRRTGRSHPTPKSPLLG